MAEPRAGRPPGPTDALRTPSLRRRVTVVVTVLMAVMLLVLVAATGLTLRERFDSQLRQRLLDRADVATALADQVEDRDLARRLEGEGVSVVLTTAGGERYAEGPLAGAADPPAAAVDDAEVEPGNAPPGPRGETSLPALPTPGGGVQQSGDLLSVSADLPDGRTVVLLADAGGARSTVAQVLVVLVVAALLVLLGTVLVVPVVVGRALGPLDRITAVARSITGGDRARRIRPQDPSTELGRTAEAFDEMLDAVVGAERRATTSEARLRDFVGDAAHELRTPVAGIQATAEHLLRDDPGRAEREAALLTLVRETRRAGRLVDDLLTMARVDRGLDLRRGVVDPVALVDGVLAARRHSHPGATLRRHGSAPAVDGDPDRLAQVVGNLVDNAVAATGGRGTVDVHLSQTGPDVVVEVDDDGPGVPDGERERVFERLVRLDPRGPGSGLGLPIARGIARAHGGDLVCVPRPSPGRGARFRFSLPAATSPPG
ncbi:sensor histidine kinase [Nocardioides sp. AX2bis]|uniref:sensor histidine kinase n=1 Tax=Nocardioides sp. AX2bis TaxID=2653157 RepID=UPI0012F2AC7A|nr:HAMP domain-containing sensor histidine kinase [Nocardioides sp. AX2bis]VXB30674.1 putative Histidine kinase [Nocardioides sp. AX2bis]